ncbi:MAG TPA: serine/threonine-protein kinase [Vicinamibacterales bacterium]|nr:serine/threonine-protein kinase [Vicinamibacterales bacterium]
MKVTEGRVRRTSRLVREVQGDTLTTERLVRRRFASTPAVSDRRQAGAASLLPADLLEEAVRRLGNVAIILFVVGVLFFAMYHLVQTGPAAVPSRLDWAILSVMSALSLGVYGLSRWPRVAPQVVLDIGLVYEVLFAFCAASLANQTPLPAEPGPAQFAPTAVIILIFPLVVPMTPGKALLVSLAAAATDPLAMGLLVLAGVLPQPDPIATALREGPNLLAVLLAFLTAGTVYRLGRKVSHARELGSYRLVRKLGEGGMGEVWEAEHRMLARPAAIKLIRASALGTDGGQVQLRRRFEREARATALLHSPHTVSLYDFGVSDDGDFFYVMERLEGVDLQRLVERFGPLPPARAVSLLRQACESLAEAHLQGLVHRDIKPANLFVCRLGLRVDHVKLLDFGLVRRQTTQEHTSAARLTLEGAAVGTPAYLAPELALGVAEADGRADLYALGCVGFWLLTGRTVFERRGAIEMAMAHIECPPEPPSRFAEMNVPAVLDAIVLRCLAKDPAERPQSAQELERALAAVPLAEPWTDDQAQRWWDKHLPKATPS